MLIGELYAESLRGKEVFSFAYNNQWLKSDFAYQLDPDLGLFEGIQYLNEDKSNFGLFLDASFGVSYLELVDFITKHGAQPQQDLIQLWRRIVFSICVSNTDDHLRNHGFVFTNKGWVLSPAYDINPVETGTGLKLNISEDDNALDLNLALSVAPYFRINKTDGERIITEIKNVVAQWKKHATSYGISRIEQENKAAAFIQ